MSTFNKVKIDDSSYNVTYSKAHSPLFHYILQYANCLLTTGLQAMDMAGCTSLEHSLSLQVMTNKLGWKIYGLKCVANAWPGNTLHEAAFCSSCFSSSYKAAMQWEGEREIVRCIALFSYFINVSFPLYDILNKKEVIYPCREQASPIWIGPCTYIETPVWENQTWPVMNMLMWVKHDIAKSVAHYMTVSCPPPGKKWSGEQSWIS